MEALDLACVYGKRFCELSYRTSAPCRTLVAVRDSSNECFLRGDSTQATTVHRVTIPLGPRPGIRFSIVFPDGSRSAPRELDAASNEALDVQARLVETPAGRLSVSATARRDLRWRFLLSSKGKPVTIDVGEPRRRVASVDLPPLDLDEDAGLLRLRAEGVDELAELEVCRLLGNRRQAVAFGAAVTHRAIESALRSAYDPKASPERLAGTLTRVMEQASPGFESLLGPSVWRYRTLMSDPRLDAEHVRLPFSFAVCRVANLQWAARRRGGTEPFPHDLVALASPSLAYPKAAPAGALRVGNPEMTYPGFLPGWPHEMTEGPNIASYRVVSDRGTCAVLLLKLHRVLPPATLRLAEQVNLEDVPFAQWGTLELPGPVLRGPEVCLLMHVANLHPDLAAYVNLNDTRMLPLRSTPASYPGPEVLNLFFASAGVPSDAKAGWLECRVPSGLLRPGRNTWVLTYENLNKAGNPSILFVYSLAIAPVPAPARKP